MSDFFQGTQVTLFANFLDADGNPINVGVSGASLDVYYYIGAGTKVFDVTSGTMTQDPDNLNRFYYLYSVSPNATITNRVVDYRAMYSGNSLEYTDSFSVLPLLSGASVNIPGSVIVSGNVINTSGSGINNAAVSIAAFGGTNNVVASTVTVSGLYTVYLNPGDYYATYSASGYLSNTVAKTVPSGNPTFNFGDITLVQVNNGSLVISDTYTTEYGVGLSGMRISLFEKGARTLTTADAIEIAYTNVSGTFTMTANPGTYVLLVEGTQQDNKVYKTAYDIDVDSAFASASSSNFRYLGTSQYNFLI
jgi:hypothetical protein